MYAVIVKNMKTVLHFELSFYHLADDREYQNIDAIN